jgi:hypothetical protein
MTVVSVLILSELRTAAAPGLRISGVTGNLSHGSVVTISGVLFGTKPTAAPIKYDDFQNLALGQELSANGWRTMGYRRPAASNARLRGGTPYTRNAHSMWPSGIASTAGGSVSNFYLTGLTNRKYLIDAWHYFTVDSDPQPQNIKPIRLHPAGLGAPNLYMNFYQPSTADSLACGRDGTSATDSAWFGTDGPGGRKPSGEFYNRWVHIQYLVDAGTGNGNSDGSCIVYLDGALRYSHRNVVVLAPGHVNWPEIYLGNYVRADAHGDIHAYWESVYIDGTWARVEIGDAPTYSDSRHREIQIPTSWSDGSISVRLNRGSFPSFSGVYMYVVDADGNASPGFCLSGTCSGGSSAPAAPTSLRIIR